MLLLAFGAVSLWLDKPNMASPETRALFCEFWLCSESNTDAPTSFDPPPDQTLRQAQAKLLLNPASAYRWADMADSEINANNLEQGKFCVRQALAAAPGNPAILFRAANFSLRLQDLPETLGDLTAVLRNPDLAAYYDRVFALYSQMDLPLDDLLNQGVPRIPKAANAILRFWIKQDKLEEAEETWTWINKNSLTTLQSAGSYVALLGKDDRWDEAIEAWSAYTTRLDSDYAKSNWVYNGSFEMKPMDCPFDWHLTSDDRVKVARDSEVFYKGSDSLRLVYAGTPDAAAPPAFQTVLLQPGTWQLHASMKTSKFTGDQGVVIRVVDADDPSKLDVVTNSFEGTEEWTSISKSFEVKSGTRLARVEILRPRARNTDIQPTGTVWLDAIVLEPQLKKESLNSAGLTDSRQPCESHGNCGSGETGLQPAAEQSREK